MRYSVHAGAVFSFFFCFSPRDGSGGITLTDGYIDGGEEVVDTVAGHHRAGLGGGMVVPPIAHRIPGRSVHPRRPGRRRHGRSAGKDGGGAQGEPHEDKPGHGCSLLQRRKRHVIHPRARDRDRTILNRTGKTGMFSHAYYFHPSVGTKQHQIFTLLIHSFFKLFLSHPLNFRCFTSPPQNALYTIIHYPTQRHIHTRTDCFDREDRTKNI